MILIVLSAIFLVGWMVWLGLARVPLMLSSARAQIATQASVISLTASVGGQVVRSSVQLGQQVQKGQLLVQLDSAAFKLQLAGVKAQIKALSSREALLRRQIRQAKRGLRHLATVGQKAQKEGALRAQRTLLQAKEAASRARQLRSLSRRGYVAREKLTATLLESRKFQIEAKEIKAQTERIRWEYRVKAGEQRARITQIEREIRTLKGTISAHRATESQLRLSLRQHQIIAPGPGKISSLIPLQPGQVIARGHLLGTLLPKSPLLVIAQFPTSQGMGKIRRGQLARVRLDAFPWTQYGSLKARVTRVAKVAHEKTLRVELSLQRSNPRIPAQHGLTGQVEVEVESISPWELLLRLVGKWVAPTQGATP